MTTENIIYSDDILKRFLSYDIDNNCKRLFTYVLSLCIRKIQQISKLRNFNFIQHSAIAASTFLSRKFLNEQVKKMDITFLEKYLLKEINCFQKKLLTKIINMKLKTEYESIFDKYVHNVLFLWNLYNQIIYRAVSLSFYFIQVNSVEFIFPNTKVDLKTKICINIYSVLFYLIEFAEDDSSKKVDTLILDKIKMETKNIFKNTFFIHEMENFENHFDKINEYLFNFISKNYFHNNVYVAISPRRNRDDLLKYILLIVYNLFTTYSGVIVQYLTEYIKNDAESIIELMHVVENLLKENQIYEEVLQSIIPDKNIISFSLDDNPILFELKDVYFTYDGKNYIYEDFNLSIKLYEWTHFRGKSGNGKSTLFNILLQRLQHQKGDVLFQNKTYNYENVKSLISVVDTGYDFFDNYTILLNITYGMTDLNDSVMDKVHYYLEKFNLKYLSSRLHDNVNFLSTGEKKRLKIIRLILHDRPIWFLDEITANLDYNIEIIVMNELARIQKEKKKTILFISHNPALENFANTVYNLEKGKITKV